ncbi:unnamed protein product [Brugia pahangi]|uniref:Zinc finger protein n=1 Tax=Brugia pahangi TaxID=6280 RepID=A0A0N4T5F0_BRUPA|nr:unnamed protein product [Brugia pahangi]
MHFIYFFCFFFQLINIQTTVSPLKAAQTDQTEPLDLSILKVRDDGHGSQGLSMDGEDEVRIGLQVLQTRTLDLSAPKLKKEGNKSQGLSVDGVSDEGIKPLLRLVPIETSVEEIELSKQGKRSIKRQRCDICGKEVTNMKKHTMVHNGEKPHSCSICKKNFAQLWDLKRHMMSHTGEKPYSCLICGKSWAQKQNLQFHMLIHDINRPIYHCTMCSKNFKSKHGLKAHMQNH